jgi:HTH-like domain
MQTDRSERVKVAHRERFGAEPICRVWGASASAYYHRANQPRSASATEDERPLARIRELHAANYYAYGYRRMWKALLRAGEQVPRCRVQRLVRTHSIVGAERRGRPWRTTRPDPEAHRRPDLVQRHFAVEIPPAEREALYAPRKETNISLNIKRGSQLPRLREKPVRLSGAHGEECGEAPAFNAIETVRSESVAVRCRRPRGPARSPCPLWAASDVFVSVWCCAPISVQERGDGRAAGLFGSQAS